jgi:phosphoribosylformylglycinamidine synthase
MDNFAFVRSLVESGKAFACWTPTYGGVAEGVLKMCMGNGFGFKFNDELTLDKVFGYLYGAFIIEVSDDVDGEILGFVTDKDAIEYKNTSIKLAKLCKAYEDKLESVYSCNIAFANESIPSCDYSATDRYTTNLKVAKPKVLIPAFPGTNCEFDSAKAVTDAGAQAEIFVIKNLSASDISESVEKFAKKVRESQMIFVPGGFSGGDEPDGSGKFITAFFRNDAIKQSVTELLEKRDGLMCGICNGFQALIKLGLVPFGKIIDTDENCPTLTFNTIGRHQSRIVRTRIASNKSPWLANTNVGDIYNVPISHGEGRFVANKELLDQLIKNGQVATQYVDLDGKPTYDVAFNPNGSTFAIEGITSPDGRVFGKMGHSERIGNGLYKNVYGEYDIKMFAQAVKYFK